MFGAIADQIGDRNSGWGKRAIAVLGGFSRAIAFSKLARIITDADGPPAAQHAEDDVALETHR